MHPIEYPVSTRVSGLLSWGPIIGWLIKNMNIMTCCMKRHKSPHGVSMFFLHTWAFPLENWNWVFWIKSAISIHSHIGSKATRFITYLYGSGGVEVTNLSQGQLLAVITLSGRCPRKSKAGTYGRNPKQGCRAVKCLGSNLQYCFLITFISELGSKGRTSGCSLEVICKNQYKYYWNNSIEDSSGRR